MTTAEGTAVADALGADALGVDALGADALGAEDDVAEGSAAPGCPQAADSSRGNTSSPAYA